MDSKVISRTNAVVQIVGLFAILVLICSLVTELLTHQPFALVIGVLPLFVWYRMSRYIWSRTSTESIDKWNKLQKMQVGKFDKTSRIVWGSLIGAVLVIGLVMFLMLRTIK